MEGLNENLKIETEWVTKSFEPGDYVRVIDGRYKGETGIVTKLEGKLAYIVLD